MSFDANSAPLRALPTPSLVLDADALERNLARMNALLEARGAFARPHTKTHKSPEIAGLQMAQPRTVGVCCARVAEAEAMVAASLTSVLVTSPIVTAEKIERFTALAAEHAGVWTVVDSELGVEALERALEQRGARCSVVVDLDPGFHRTGVEMGQPAVALARRIAASERLELRGLQMYAGTLQHLDSAAERQEKSTVLWRKTLEIAGEIRALGEKCEVLTGGGTGTFDIDAEIGVATDLQVGSYVFMDAQYRAIESPVGRGAASDAGGGAAAFDDFEPALFVVAAAISQSVPELITVDAGFKALACDHVPEVSAFPDMRYHYAGDEHGMIQLGEEPGRIALGDRVALLVSHCDPTVNLHDHYVVLRGGAPAEQWPIAARGRP